MQRSSLNALAATAVMASLLCAPGLASAQTTYKLTLVDANINASVTGMNDEGNLVLTINNNGIANTYLWRNGKETNIGGLAPGAAFVESGGLNDLVEVVGSTISPTSGNFCAFRWQFGHMYELTSPPGSEVVFGIAVNLLGQVAGISYDANFNGQVVVWNQGRPTVLPGLPGSDFAQPVSINLTGQVVGYADDTAGVSNTVLWKHGTPTVIVPNSAPAGLNDVGQVVGTTRAELSVPFLWQNGVTTTLPALPGLLPYGAAEGINDLGQIVGISSGYPVMWWNGSVVNLNDQIAKTDPLQPYVHLQNPSLINNRGQIVATGTDSRSSSLQQWYLLTPMR
jgi:uncharacterized membrane protein